MHWSEIKPEMIQVVWDGHWREMKVESYCWIRKLAIGTIEGARILATVDDRAARNPGMRWVGTVIMDGFTGGTLHS